MRRNVLFAVKAYSIALQREQGPFGLSSVTHSGQTGHVRLLLQLGDSHSSERIRRPAGGGEVVRNEGREKEVPGEETQGR